MAKANKKNELGYPIVYAPLQIKERGGYLNNYEIITLGHIVSKCYVLESIIKYLPNGDAELYYKVVFPYNDISALSDNKTDLGNPNIPSKTSDYDIVTEIFDNYDDAKKCVEDKNNLLELWLSTYKPTLLPDGDIDKYNIQLERYNAEYAELKKELSLCKEFEKLVLNETKKMHISRVDGENNNKLVKRYMNLSK